MGLGSSIRRRRTRTRREPEPGGDVRLNGGAGGRGNGPAGRGNRAGRGARRLGLRGAGLSAGRRAGIVLSVASSGGLAGYCVSTAFYFPAPDPPASLQGVPDLEGVVLAQAMRSLADSGLVVGGIDSVRHPLAPRGTVIGQRPLPGRTALPGAAVTLAVSSGSAVRAVPDVTRMPGERAAAVLAAAGFAVLVDTVDSDNPAGQVIAIDPPPGDSLPLLGSLRILLSSGPPTFPMPDLAGMDERRAAAVLDSLGLVVGGVERRFSLLNQGAVFGQSPPPETRVERGRSVDLVVGEIPRPRLRRR